MAYASGGVIQYQGYLTIISARVCGKVMFSYCLCVCVCVWLCLSACVCVSRKSSTFLLLLRVMYSSCTGHCTGVEFVERMKS